MTTTDTGVRLLARIVKVETGCWRWTGAHISTGYGHISHLGKPRGVHIVAYETWIGPLAPGFEIDHVHARGCRYRDCINPDHLEAVTRVENLRRRAALITHCPHGHEYTPANVKWTKGRNGVLHRRCRRCFNDTERARKAKRRGER